MTMRHQRREVVARTKAEFARLDRVAQRLTPADWRKRVPRGEGKDPWTVKDALAHIAYWKAHSARFFRGEKRLPEMRGLEAPCHSAHHRVKDIEAALKRSANRAGG
jgi:type II secretory pathway component PulM